MKTKGVHEVYSKRIEIVDNQNTTNSLPSHVKSMVKIYASTIHQSIKEEKRKQKTKIGIL